MTFSIVAWEPALGVGGIAVATRAMAVGALCVYARAHVGVCAIHGLVNPQFGSRALELLALQVSPEDTLRLLLDDDESYQQRQIHLVDHNGTSAAYTGDAVGAWAGHKTFPAHSVAGSTLAGPEPLQVLAETYNRHLASLSLPERLLCALEAAEAAGGDTRGRQSAALYVTPLVGGLPIDLRVDDHSAPLAELRRIFDKAKDEHPPLRYHLNRAESTSEKSTSESTSTPSTATPP